MSSLDSRWRTVTSPCALSRWCERKSYGEYGLSSHRLVGDATQLGGGSATLPPKSDYGHDQGRRLWSWPPAGRKSVEHGRWIRSRAPGRGLSVTYGGYCPANTSSWDNS